MVGPDFRTRPPWLRNPSVAGRFFWAPRGLGSKWRVKTWGRDREAADFSRALFNEWGRGRREDQVASMAPSRPGAATCVGLSCRWRGVRFHRLPRWPSPRQRKWLRGPGPGPGSGCTALSRGAAASGRGCARETDGRAAGRWGRGPRPGLGLPWVPGRRPRPRDQPEPRSGLTCWAEPGVAARARSGRGPRAMPCTDWL